MSPGFIATRITFEERMLWPTMPARQNRLGGVPERLCTSMLPMPQNSPWPSSATLSTPTAAPRVTLSSWWQRERIEPTGWSAQRWITSQASSAATDDSAMAEAVDNRDEGLAGVL